MVPAVSEFLKGGIGESVKKLVQPSAVVPATVFVILNLVFVYPTLESQGFAFTAEFKELDEAWKVAILGLISLLLGYLLLSFGASTLRLMTGELWRGSWLGAQLISSKRKARERLEKALRAEYMKANEAELSRLKWTLGRLPPGDYLLPTHLGNVLNGAAHSVYRRYGMD